MRAALAAAAAALVLLSAASPHQHAGIFGSHACVACVVQGAEAAHSETPEVAPPPEAPDEARPLADAAPARGTPLGAIPGQSPPAA